MITNPDDWNKVPYDNNLNASQATKTIDLSDYHGATIRTFIDFNSNDSGDVFSFHANGVGGSTTLASVSDNDTGNNLVNGGTLKLGNCAGGMCTLSAQVTTDGSGQSKGFGIGFMWVDRLQRNTTACEISSGTSMATPMVAGTAALLKAYRPDATSTQIINAIYSGGTTLPSLTGKTTQGKMINVQGALDAL